MAFRHSLQERSHLLNTCRLPWGGVTAIDALEAFMEVPPQLLDTWLPPSPPALPFAPPPPPHHQEPTSLWRTSPNPQPRMPSLLAQTPVYFRCSSCHMLTIILSVSSLRFLHWMSALRVGIWSSLLCPQRGAQCLVCADWTCCIL